MPTFGDFESYGEPLSVTEARDHVTTLWRARRCAGGEPDFVAKCFTPQRRGGGESHPDDPLDTDPAHQFIESVKQLKKAQDESPRNLCRVHAFGFADGDAFSITDHHARGTLKAWIAKKGSVDSAALKHVVSSIVAGCLALKRSRGFSHGNLKPSNILLGGNPRPLRHTPLLLMDAHPIASLQAARVAREDRGPVGDLFHQAALQRAALVAFEDLLVAAATRFSGVFVEIGRASCRERV